MKRKTDVGRILPGLFLSLTLFLLGPAQIYLTNAGEFWFSFGQVLPMLLLFLAGSTLLCSLLLFLLPERPSLLTECVLHTLTLLLYLQGNFLLISYGTLNGSAVNWSDFTAPMLLSDALWVLLLLLAVFFAARKGEKLRRFLRLAAGLAVLAQALSLGASLLTARPAEKSPEPRYLSKAGEFSLSRKQNTVLFLLDCFDAGLFRNLSEADPAWAQETLRDFIFLPDTVGGATRTKYAIPLMLTGKAWTEPLSYPAYLREAYAASPLLQSLQSTGTDAALYTNKVFVDPDSPWSNLAEGTGEVSDAPGLAGDFMKLTAFRYAPASLARFFWMYTGDFEKWKISGVTGEYALNDPLFFEELKGTGLSADTDAPCFRFYHLTGAHDPYAMDENARPVTDGTATEEGQARGCFTIISEYLRQLKSLGLYDNTTVLILADHGNYEYGGREQNPLLLIRPAGHTGAFTVSDQPFSYFSLSALLSDAVLGQSPDPSRFPAPDERLFYSVKEEAVRVNITEYRVPGKAWDNESVTETGRVFHGDTLSYTGEYRLGTEVSFGLGDNAKAWMVSGFWRNDGTRTWTVGKKAEMRFVASASTPLTLTMKYGTFDGDQQVNVLVNGTPVDSYIAHGEETRSILIPREALGGGEILLTLELPTARSPLTVGTGSDERELGLYMESLKLSAPVSGSAASLTDLPGLLLGRVMDLCCRLTGSCGWAILLFTLFSKLLLLPVSLWVHRNSLKVVRLRPDINRLNIRHFGNRDAVAEGQAALYKKEKYRPLASLVPLFLQILLLLGVIGAIRQPRPDYSPLFLGLNLTLSAGDPGSAGLLLPLLAGLSSLLLSLAESRITPLQRVQGLPARLSTAAFSVALSLYLGFFVPGGVVLYWVLSNLLAIPLQLLMNRLIPPEKYVNWAEIESTQAELNKLKHLDADAPSKEKRKLRRREKADYKRFFSVSNKHLVFYSESNGFYKYFGPVIDEILARSTAIVHYITSDPKDDIFRRAAENPRIRAYYIGPRKLITLFMMMDADVVVMTMSDLDNYHYKRSYVRKDIRYIYMFHYPLSTHMVLHTGALDHYDEILCVGAFQVPEIRRQEELYHLPPKRLEVCGYCQLDSLFHDFEALPPPEKTSILIAPSWQEGNLLDSCLDPLLKGLLGRGWDVTVRPHPEYMKRYRPAMEAIERRWASYEGGDLFFETDFTSSRSIYASSLVITDWSGTAAEFSLVTLRPCLYIDTPPKINNPRYTDLNIEPQEFLLRDQLGLRLSPEDAALAGDRISVLLQDHNSWSSRIRAVRENLIANFPDSAPVSARAILQAVLEEQQRRKEEEDHA